MVGGFSWSQYLPCIVNCIAVPCPLPSIPEQRLRDAQASKREKDILNLIAIRDRCVVSDSLDSKTTLTRTKYSFRAIPPWLLLSYTQAMEKKGPAAPRRRCRRVLRRHAPSGRLATPLRPDGARSPAPLAHRSQNSSGLPGQPGMLPAKGKLVERPIPALRRTTHIVRSTQTILA